jgi:L,D-transpeptidase catalytic domain
VAIVSYLRPASKPPRLAVGERRGLGAPPSSPRRGRYVAAGALVAVVVALAAGAIVIASSGATLTADATALARVGLPLGGGRITSVQVVSGPHSKPILVQLRGSHQIWPQGLVPARETVSIDVVVKRPGWISWLTGSSEKLHLTLITPSARLRNHYLTLREGEPITLNFRSPIRVIAYGPPGQLTRRVLAAPESQIKLHRIAEAGTLSVAAAPRTWETSKPALVSWFPAGAAATAVASPAPGTTITPRTAIALTFSKTVSQALGNTQPPVSPASTGAWHTINPHTIVFKPRGYGYGLGAKVSIGLPNGVRLVGGSGSGGTWTVPGGSPLRLQQLLAVLGYLPLSFKYAGSPPGTSPAAQEAAAIHPPKGQFVWRYPNVPAALHSFWSPGASGVMTQGALMAFEDDHSLTTDGLAGPEVWRALINAAVAGDRSSFGYSFVQVSTASQSLVLWHNGRQVLTTAVNTGIASAPTATGTYPVYEHISVGTMSGTNPDGSHYNDPGIQFISYFNGGDALHAFTRAQYGFPQSLGCVEMALGPAGQVWPYTPIGTLVHVV